jgi:putative PIN family toxin of toxin-antitoxin system
MIVTIDTNVIFAALYSAKGASHKIFELIVSEDLKIAVSVQTYFEYYDVLTREANLKKLRLTVAEVEDILDLLALLAQQNTIYFLLRPNLSDQNDNIFVECAFASNSDYLITSNVKDFKQGELKGFRHKVVTPGEFYQIWRIRNE